MAVLKPDGFDVNAITLSGTNFDGGFQSVQCFCDATVAIAAGDWIAVYPTTTADPGGTDGYEYRIANSGNVGAATDTIGVALQALASGTGFIQVQISGYNTIANVDSGASVANGDPLCIGATGGRAIEQVLDAATTANRRTIGICRSTPSANVATVEILRHPRFAGP